MPDRDDQERQVQDPRDPRFRRFRQEARPSPDLDPRFRQFAPEAAPEEAEELEAGTLPPIRARPPGQEEAPGRMRPPPGEPADFRAEALRRGPGVHRVLSDVIVEVVEPDPEAGTLPPIRARPPGAPDPADAFQELMHDPEASDPVQVEPRPDTELGEGVLDPGSGRRAQPGTIVGDALESQRLRNILLGEDPDQVSPRQSALGYAGAVSLHTVRELTASIPESIGVTLTEGGQRPLGPAGGLGLPGSTRDPTVHPRGVELAERGRESLLELADTVRGPDLEIPDDPRLAESWLLNNLVPGMASMFGFMAVGIATGPLGAGILATTSGASRSYQEALEAGLSEEEARRRAGFGTMAGAVQVTTPLMILRNLNRATGGTAFRQLRKVAQDAGVSGLNELVVNSAGEVGFNLIAGRPMWENFAEAMRDGAATAFVTSMLLGVPMVGVRRSQARDYLAQTQEAAEILDRALEAGVTEEGVPMTQEERSELLAARADLHTIIRNATEFLGQEAPAAPLFPAGEEVTPFTITGQEQLEAVEGIPEETPEITPIERQEEPVAPEAEPEAAPSVPAVGQLSPELESLARRAFTSAIPGMGDRSSEMAASAEIARLPPEEQQLVRGRIRVFREERDQISGDFGPEFQAPIQEGAPSEAAPEAPAPAPGPEAIRAAAEQLGQELFGLEWIDAMEGPLPDSMGELFRGALEAAEDAEQRARVLEIAEAHQEHLAPEELAQIREAAQVAPEAPAPEPPPGLPTPAPAPEAEAETAVGPAGDQAVVTAPVPMGEPVRALEGGETTVRVADGRQLRARYAVVDAREAPTSHDPETLQPDPAFPEGIQERRYHRDPGAREQLQEATRQFDAGRIQDPTTMAVGGPPIVRPDGVRLSGNFRGMLVRRAQRQNPDAYQDYLDGLVAQAETWGLDAGELQAELARILEDGGTPELVRVVTDADVDLVAQGSLAEWMSAFNDVPTRARDPLGEAATRARRMQEADEALAHLQETLPPDETVRSYLGTAAGQEFLRALVRDGVFSREEVAQLYDRRTQQPTDEAKTQIERLLLLTAVQDADIVDAAPPGTLRKIEKAIPALIRAQRFEGWDLTGVLQEALQIHAEARAAGLQVIEQVQQIDMTREPYSVEGERLALFLADNTQVPVSRAVRAYAEEASAANDALETEDLFGWEPRTPQDALMDHFAPDRDIGEAGGATVRERRARYQRWRRWIAGVISPELRAEAETDGLTGLSNPRMDQRRVEEGLERREEAPRTQLVRYRLDLDNFKSLNDERGHQVGDQALRAVADALQEGMREEDVVSLARVGGDEFAFSTRIPEDADPSTIRDRIENQVNLALQELGLSETSDRNVGVSIGFAVHREGETFLELDARADQEAIARKAENGRSRPRNDQARIRERMRRFMDQDGELTPADRTESAQIHHGSELQATRVAEEVAQLSMEMATVSRVPVDLSAEGRMRRVAEAGKRAWVSPLGKRVRGPGEIEKILRPFVRSPQMETMAVVLTDAESRIVHAEGISSGALDFVNIGNEFAAYIRTLAERHGAEGVYLAHNHPSGDPAPSPDDMFVTRNIVEELEGNAAGAEFRGHYVFNHQTGYWISWEQDPATGKHFPKSRLFAVASAPSRDWTNHRGVRADPRLTRESVEAMVGPLQEGNAHILWLDNGLRVVAHSPHHPSALQNLGDWYEAQRERLAAAFAVVVLPDDGTINYDGLSGREAHRQAAERIRRFWKSHLTEDLRQTILDVFYDRQTQLTSGIQAQVYENLMGHREFPDDIAQRVFRYAQTAEEATGEPVPERARRAAQLDIFETWSSPDPGHRLEPLTPAPLTPIRPFQVHRDQYVGTSSSRELTMNPELIKRHREWRLDTLAAVSEGLISPEEARERGLNEGYTSQFAPLPKDLWHVTIALEGVLQQGLRSPAQLGPSTIEGLGTGVEDPSLTETISLTTAQNDVEVIRDTLRFGRQVLRGDVTVDELVDMARAGEGANRPWVEAFLKLYWHGWKEGEPIPSALRLLRQRKVLDPETMTERFGTGQEIIGERFRMLKAWLRSRTDAGGAWDPVFITKSPELLVYTRPDDIAVVRARAVDGAMGVESGYAYEWKVYSGKAVEIVQVDGRPVEMLREPQDPYDPSWSNRIVAPIVYQAAHLNEPSAELASRKMLEHVRVFQRGEAREVGEDGSLVPIQEVPGRSDIIRDIEAVVARPFQIGKMRRLARAFGFYRLDRETFSIRVANDVDVIAHELGHHVHKLLFDIDGERTHKFPQGRARVTRSRGLDEQPLKLWEHELMPLATTSDKSISEGFAEFWRIWLTNKEEAERLAPQLAGYLEGRLAVQFPELWMGMQRWQRAYEAYAQGSPWARILAQLAQDPPRRPGGARRKFHRLYHQVVNDFVFLDQFEQQMTGLQQATPEFIRSMPGHLADLARGTAGEADHILRRGPIDVEGNALEEVEIVDREKMGPVIQRVRRMQRAAKRAGAERRAQIERQIGRILRGTEIETTTRPAKSLEAILNQVEDAELQDFEVYAVARRARELHEREIETGLEDADVEATIEEYDRIRPNYAEAFEDLQAYNTALLQLLRDGGVISPSTYRAIVLNNLDYVPFFRRMDSRDGRTGGPSGSRGLHGHIFSPIRQIKGSGRDILSPLDSILKNTFLYTRLVANQQVSQAVFELAQLEGSGEWLQAVQPPSRVTQVHRDEILDWLFAQEAFEEFAEEVGKDPADILSELDASELNRLFEDTMLVFRPGEFFNEPNVISILQEDGSRQWFKVDPDLYDSIVALSPERTNKLVEIASYPAQWLRAGATGMSPEFIFRNPFRDQFVAVMQSEFGYLPGVDLMRGLFHLIGKTDAYWMWKRSRGQFASLVDMDRKAVRERGQSMLGAGRIPHVVKNPLVGLQVASAWMENATRLGEYTNAIRAGGERMGVIERLVKEMQPSWRAAASARLRGEGVDRGLQLVAGHASREIGTNYSTHGAHPLVQFARLTVPFWNARLQGHQRWVRAFRENPVGTSLRAFTAIMIPEMILYSINRDDPDWWEQPQWMRDYFHLVKIPTPFGNLMPEWMSGTPEDHPIRAFFQPFENQDGTIWLRFPKAFELGIALGGMTTRTLEWLDGEDPEEVTRALGETFRREVTSTFAPFPQFALPLVENATNYSFFFDRNLDPPYLTDVAPGFRPGRNELLEEFGRFQNRVGIPARLQQSPNQMENLWLGYTGTLGRHALRGAEMAYRGARRALGDEVPARPWEFGDIPAAGGFIARDPVWNSESVQRLFREWQAVDASMSTLQLFEREDQHELMDQFYPPEEQAVVRQRWAELRGVLDQMSALRSQRDMIRRDPEMPAEEKWDRERELGRHYQELARDAIRREFPTEGARERIEVTTPGGR
jgi:diguanylate cyclase (GGDEF)-like protein